MRLHLIRCVLTINGDFSEPATVLVESSFSFLQITVYNPKLKIADPLTLHNTYMARFYITIYRDAYEELLRLSVSCDGLDYKLLKYIEEITNKVKQI